MSPPIDVMLPGGDTHKDTMAKLIITGSSDDLIEIEGEFREEFNVYTDDQKDGFLLAVSDGTLLNINYDQDGIWRIKRLKSGGATFNKVEGDVERDTNDVVTLEGDPLKWVVLGINVAMKETTRI